RWRERADRVEADTPLNFVTTADITGGSSGSPAFDSAGHLVGIVFDTNIHGLLWDYRYDDALGRSICVDGRAVTEALRKVYDAQALADELLGGRN
ncbi:MAG: S46 family peptidase, partial [Phycisphaerae bacterium]